MRVIAGEFRSRKLLSLPGLDTRPTPDRLRESLFSILTQRIEGSVFVDAYAGTGAVGIEAVSRGARLAVFIESSRAAADVIRQNIASLKIESRSRLVRAEAAKSAAEMASADIVFADPPYTKEDEFAAFLNAVTAGCQALTIVQHPVRLVLAPEYGGFQRTRSFRQGDNALSFYEAIR